MSHLTQAAKWVILQMGKNFPNWVLVHTSDDGVMAADERIKAAIEQRRLALGSQSSFHEFVGLYSLPYVSRFETHVNPHAHFGKVHDFSTEVIDSLIEILTGMAFGNAVTLIPSRALLTTRQAAEYLNVSMSYVESLLDDEKIPFRVSGDDRKIEVMDLVAYKKQSDAKRRAALEELSTLGQEIDEGF